MTDYSGEMRMKTRQVRRLMKSESFVSLESQFEVDA
jgi:hypothetical protein